ncbi:MAG: hypothetical protein KY461_05745 [Actinobacteria bacterium]|nr:hypothetical protein [Actinomycetota bacterium]
MRRPLRTAAVVAAAVFLGACRIGDGGDPVRDSATVSETLPEDAGDLENPSEVTSPGGGAGETEER